MLKLNASYSKKVPAEDDYSSRSYHAAVEIELPDGLSSQELQGRISATFQLVRDSVEAELAGHAPIHTTSAPVTAANAPVLMPERGNGPKASDKQLGFLTDLAVRKHMSRDDLAHEVQQRFGVSSIQQLSRSQASALIDALGDKHQRRAA